MRGVFVLLLALAIAAVQTAAEEFAMDPEDAAEVLESNPNLMEFSKECQTEFIANPTDPEKFSPRCREELAKKIMASRGEMDREEAYKKPDAADAAAEAEARERLGRMSLSEEEFLQRLTKRCRAEYEANPTDPEKVSARCRNEIAKKIQRQMEKEKRAESGEPEEVKPKPKPRLTKKQKRAEKRRARLEQQAAEEAKQQEQQMRTVKIIVGFVVTMLAVLIGAVCVINRKLKAAGMYYPADPMAKASCCGGGCE